MRLISCQCTWEKGKRKNSAWNGASMFFLTKQLLLQQIFLSGFYFWIYKKAWLHSFRHWPASGQAFPYISKCFCLCKALSLEWKGHTTLRAKRLCCEWPLAKLRGQAWVWGGHRIAQAVNLSCPCFVLDVPALLSRITSEQTRWVFPFVYGSKTSWWIFGLAFCPSSNHFSCHNSQRPLLCQCSYAVMIWAKEVLQKGWFLFPCIPYIAGCYQSLMLLEVLQHTLCWLEIADSMVQSPAEDLKHVSDFSCRWSRSSYVRALMIVQSS